MTTEIRFGMDWRRKGMICWDARPTDAPNLLPTPMTYMGVNLTAIGTGATITRNETATDYGKLHYAVQTGTDVNAGFKVQGQEDDANAYSDTIAVSASSNYGVAIWLKGISGYTGIPFVVNIKDQTDTILFSSSSFNLTDDWVQVTASGSTGVSSDYIRIEVVKNNDATDVQFQATGFMQVAGTTIPTAYNAGSADRYDNLTAYVKESDLVLGMRQAYQDVASKATCDVTINNVDKTFSPENTSSPLSGYIAPYRPVQIQSVVDNGTPTTHFTGWVETLQPDVNQYGKREVTIKSAGPMLYFVDADTDTDIELQENKLTSEIIETLLQQALFPPALSFATVIDAEGYNRLDIETWIADYFLDYSIQTGKTQLAYVADNWIQRGGSASKDGEDTFSVYRAIQDVTMAERGRFFFDRDGVATFWNRHHLPTNKEVQAVFDDSMHEMQYTYAGLNEFKNEVTVVCYPRTISASDDVLLWSLDKPATITPVTADKPLQELTASFRDDSDNRIGGKDVTLGTVEFSQGDAQVTMEAFANRAKLTIVNSGSEDAILSTCEIRGKKITDFGRMEATVTDGVSATLYGKRSLNMNLPSIDNFEFAETIANFEISRRKNPSGKVSQMTLRSLTDSSGGIHDSQLNLTIGDRIRIVESQAEHATSAREYTDGEITGYDEEDLKGQYFIIGEAHKLVDSGTVLETTWYLEYATEANWMIIGNDETDSSFIDSTDVIMWY